MGFSHLHSQNADPILPRKGRRRLKGYTTYVDHTGLIHVVPKARKRGLPIFQAFVLIALVIVFKALAMINVGIADYTDKVAGLKAGGLGEQVAGWMLTPDTATTAIYNVLFPLLS